MNAPTNNPKISYKKIVQTFSQASDFILIFYLLEQTAVSHRRPFLNFTFHSDEISL